LKGSHVAKRFARAFAGKVPAGQEKELLGELAAVARVIGEAKALRSMFLGPLFSDDEKTAALKSMVRAAGLSAPVGSFLETLLDQNKMFLLDEIVAYAETFLNERMKRTRASVISAVALPGDAIDRLRGVLARWTGKSVALEAAVDPGLLGGLVVRVGSQVFDASIKGQMNQMRQEFIKG